MILLTKLFYINTDIFTAFIKIWAHLKKFKQHKKVQRRQQIIHYPTILLTVCEHHSGHLFKCVHCEKENTTSFFSNKSNLILLEYNRRKSSQSEPKWLSDLQLNA